MKAKDRDYTTIQAAYDAGKAARCASQPVDGNPHDHGNHKYSWYKGWYEENTKRFLEEWESRRKERKEGDD